MIACAAGFGGGEDEGPPRPVVVTAADIVVFVCVYDEPTRVLADQGSAVRDGAYYGAQVWKSVETMEYQGIDLLQRDSRSSSDPRLVDTD